MIRGYSIQQQFSFLDTQYEPQLKERLMSGIPEDVRRAIRDLKPAEWYPRRYSVAVLQAIASPHKDDTSAYNELLRCGTFIATEATNTFLKILMKMLTPALFAKKLPEFWQRDQQGGHVEVDVSQAKSGHIQLRICDVEGYDHMGPVSAGWMQFAMAAMGKQNVSIKQQGWSLRTPGPKEVTYDLKWS